MFYRRKGNKLFSKIAKISYLCTHSGTNFSYFFRYLFDFAKNITKFVSWKLRRKEKTNFLSLII